MVNPRLLKYFIRIAIMNIFMAINYLDKDKSIRQDKAKLTKCSHNLSFDSII